MLTELDSTGILAELQKKQRFCPMSDISSKLDTEDAWGGQDGKFNHKIKFISFLTYIYIFIISASKIKQTYTVFLCQSPQRKRTLHQTFPSQIHYLIPQWPSRIHGLFNYSILNKLNSFRFSFCFDNVPSDMQN